MTVGLVKVLKELGERDIEYILVGGMAAVLHGAPVTTQDIDIVHRRTPHNIERLLTFLKDSSARYRGQPKGRNLFPTNTLLEGDGHHNLITDYGPLDLLCELAKGQGYEQLLPFKEVMKDRSGICVQIISLKKLIEIKSETGRPKDDLMIPLLLKLDEHC